LCFVLAGAALGWLVAGSAGPAAAARARPVVYEVSIAGGVDSSTASLVGRGVDEARRAHADALLVRLDTPGGLDSSMRQIVKALQGSTVPVICWVGPSGARAASAGTFIVISCPVAAMAPGTNIGAAHPVSSNGGTLSEKITNDAAAYIRALAQSRGRNADWAERAVRSSVSVSAADAVHLHVVDLIAPGIPALFRSLDGRRVDAATSSHTLHLEGAAITQVHFTSGERFLHWLSDADLGFLLFVFGIGGIVFEIFHPGLNVPGLVGVVLFVLSLVVFDTLPINWAGAALVLLAFVLFVVDVKVSAHGLPTLAGITLFVLGGLLLYHSSGGARVSRPLLITLAAMFAAFFLVVVRAGMLARRAPVVSGVERLVGRRGTVLEDLDPTGQVRVGGEVWAARVSGEDAGSVFAGATIEVLAIQGLTLVVAPTDQLGLELEDGSIKPEVPR
jgi:membrane-bound serine protease (ClpP class)